MRAYTPLSETSEDREGQRSSAARTTFEAERMPGQTTSWLPPKLLLPNVAEVDPRRMNERIRKHERIWDTVRTLERERLLILLARTLDHLAVDDMELLLADHERGTSTPMASHRDGSLLEVVEHFCKAARTGAYFQELWAKGKYGSYLPSPKTEEFGAKLTLLLNLCVAETEEGEPKEVCDAYEMLLGLLEEIDRFDRNDIVFWADEPGTWQLGIDWVRVIPAYLHCLAKVLPPKEFGEKASTLMAQLNPLDAAKLGPLVADLVGRAASSDFR